MVELKAVSAGFPYYGVLRLEGGQAYRYDQIAGFGALVRPELLAQLGLAVGDEVSLGGRAFRIRGVIEAEPGRRLGAFSLGPRVIVALPDLEQTGLLAFGSRATYQRLAKVADAALAAAHDDAARRPRRTRSSASAPTPPPRTTWARTSPAPRTTCRWSVWSW